ncbi:hypothetical protein LINPERPRIM_LOCUS36350 [Linum perenne]
MLVPVVLVVHHGGHMHTTGRAP